MTQKIDRQEEFSGTRDVREAHRFDETALDAYLRDHVEGYSGPLTVEQFKGGQSNPTYKLTTPGREYVLRRKPPGKLLPSAHAVDREYKVIAALHKLGLPVPRPFLLCEDDSVIGTAFYVMDFAAGPGVLGTAHARPGRARPRRHLRRHEPLHGRPAFGRL
jgi:aminoglycoside phosphotransferase (APT) family kinase protein